jgi:hypothetical protein
VKLNYSIKAVAHELFLKNVAFLYLNQNGSSYLEEALIVVDSNAEYGLNLISFHKSSLQYGKAGQTITALPTFIQI